MGHTALYVSFWDVYIYIYIFGYGGSKILSMLKYLIINENLRYKQLSQSIQWDN